MGNVVTAKLTTFTTLALSACQDGRWRTAYALADSLPAALGHRPTDPTTSAIAALMAQIDLQLSGSVRTSAFPKVLANSEAQIGILSPTLVRALAPVSVKSTAADLQGHANFLESIIVLFQFVYQRQVFKGSWPKMAQAFLKCPAGDSPPPIPYATERFQPRDPQLPPRWLERTLPPNRARSSAARS